MGELAAVAETINNNIWGVKILPKPKDCPKSLRQSPAQIDYSELPRVHTKKHLIEGYKTPNGSIEISRVIQHDEKTLKVIKKAREFATISSIALNALSGIGLTWGAIKLLLSNLNGGDTEGAYKTLGRGFALGGASGVMTGLAHDSGAWTLGNLGMAISGVAGLDNPSWLALHTLSDGLASQGMSSVRYRQKGNPVAITRSIFNNPLFQKYNFLQPTEQAIYQFLKSFTSKDGLRSFFVDEPYRLFRRAAGGLISASSILGVASLFKNKMPEKMSSFFFLPYSLLSMVNVIAFARDGQMELKRARAFSGTRPYEDFAHFGEGYTKFYATPFLGIRNLFLALKGLGVETNNSLMYHLSMVSQALGAASAMFGFGFQSFIKFLKRSVISPLAQEEWEVKINPKKAFENTFSVIENQKKLNNGFDSKSQIYDEFKTIIDNCRFGKALNEIISTSDFQRLKHISQTGLPSFSIPYTHVTVDLNRYDHSIGVGAIAMLVIDELLKNPLIDNRIKQEINSYKKAFIAGCLIHDVRHLARSHVLEKAIEGHDNDELLMWMLQDKNAEITKVLIKHFGEDTLDKIKEIMGHKHWLFKVFKDCDRMEYQGFSEYPRLKHPRLEFFNATVNDVRDFASTIIPFVDTDKKINLSYLPGGAVQKLSREYARYMNMEDVRGALEDVEANYSYCVGLAANPNVNSENIKTMSQDEVDYCAQEGLEYINGGITSFKVEINTGNDNYVGYEPANRHLRILVNDDNQVLEISEWNERNVKISNPDLYKLISDKLTTLRRPTRKIVRALLSNKF